MTDDGYWCGECGAEMTGVERMFYGTTCSDCRDDVDMDRSVDVRCFWCSRVKKATDTCCRVKDVIG